MFPFFPPSTALLHRLLALTEGNLKNGWECRHSEMAVHDFLHWVARTKNSNKQIFSTLTAFSGTKESIKNYDTVVISIISSKTFQIRSVTNERTTGVLPLNVKVRVLG